MTFREAGWPGGGVAPLLLVPDEKLAELNPPPEIRSELGPFLISTSTSSDGGVGDSTVTPSPALHAGGVVGSASRFTCFSLRARRRYFFFIIFFTVLTGAAVPALR